MKNLIVLALAGAGILAASMAISAEDPISVRKAMMKDQGAAMGTLAKMAKGELAFDALAAEMAIRVLHSASYGVGFYFPKGSETGMETTSAPSIWEKPGEFEAAFVKYRAATTAALAKTPKSKDQLGPILGAVGENCSSCHKVFRIKKDG